MRQRKLLGMIFGAMLVPSAWAWGADQVDPALAQSWQFMQSAMPGVPYDVLKTACAEGTVTLYHGTWSDAEAARAAAFKKRFPCIDVKRTEFQSTVLREKFLAEGRSNHSVGDVIQDSDPGALNNAAKEGLLMNYVISNDKDYANSVKNKGFWYPIRFGIIGNAWNTNEVKPDQAKILSDWKGVVDPAWKGRAGVTDPGIGGSALLFWYSLVKMHGMGVIQQVGTLKPRIFGGVNPAAASLVSGDIDVLLGISEAAFTTEWLKGAPIQWSLPEPGIGTGTGQAVVAHPAHPNAAKLYQEYSFSLEGYQAWQKLGGPPARIGYKDQRDVAKKSWYKYPTKFFAYDPADTLASSAQIVAEFKKYVGSAH